MAPHVCPQWKIECDNVNVKEKRERDHRDRREIAWAILLHVFTHSVND